MTVEKHLVIVQNKFPSNQGYKLISCSACAGKVAIRPEEVNMADT